MLIIRECRMRALILTELAKDTPELEIQLLYVAKKMAAPGNFKGATQRRCGSTAFRFPAISFISQATPASIIAALVTTA